VEILDRVGSKAVKVYYDVCNSNDRGYDIYKEIRRLGPLICEFHAKENGSLLGQGKVDFQKVRAAMNDIGYSGWIQIEGNAFSTPQFWVGVLFAVIGLLAMIWAASGHFWAGLLGGILAGLGVAVLLVTFGLMFLGSWTPAIVVAVLVILGPILGLINSRGATPPPTTPAT